MAIIQTCDFYDVQSAFERFDCQDNFTPAGLRVLVDYLEELSDSMEQPIELDVVAWCCEYTEDTVDDIVQSYNLEDEVTDMDEDEKRQYVMDYLQDNTILCGKTVDGFVYQVF